MRDKAIVNFLGPLKRTRSCSPFTPLDHGRVIALRCCTRFVSCRNQTRMTTTSFQQGWLQNWCAASLLSFWTFYKWLQGWETPTAPWPAMFPSSYCISVLNTIYFAMRRLWKNANGRESFDIFSTPQQQLNPCCTAIIALNTENLLIFLK